MSKTLKNTSRRGFTLIELLVVIAIISIISSITMTSLSAAKAKARDARRLADLRTLATAIQLFYNDNGTYPINNSTKWYGDWTSSFKSQLSPYLPNPPIDPLNNGSTRYYSAWSLTESPDPKCKNHYVLWMFPETTNANSNTCGFLPGHHFLIVGKL